MNGNNYSFSKLLIAIIISSCSIKQNIDQVHYQNILENSEGILYLNECTEKEEIELAKVTNTSLSTYPYGENQREIIKRNWKALFINNRYKMEGKISTKLCFNRQGIVKYIEILPIETTVTHKAKLKRALIAAKGYEIEKDSLAPILQCGKLVFNLDIN